ncbi:RNA-directed DNA polymerase, eukaryota, reverse transcriptase zinc-binding domain protein [Tanacetum coccineum]
MRSKRNIEPTKIFNNYVLNTSRNLNKQKPKGKNNKNMNDGMDGIVGKTGKNDHLVSTEIDDHGDASAEYETKDGRVMKYNSGSVDEEVFSVDSGIQAQSEVNANETVIEKENQMNEVGDNGDDGCILESVNIDSHEIESSKVSTNDQNIVTPVAAHNESPKQSYAKVTTKLESMIENKLKSVPTECDENGGEFVIFDDELIKDCSNKWKFTVCGYFVGHKMNINFHHERGMNEVLEKGPWMVINKPLVVQKWDIHMNIKRTEPDKLPISVRLCNLPLEAWSINGISALASKIMEVQAKKGLPEKIDVVYKNAEKDIIGHKSVSVKYDWVCNTPKLGRSGMMCIRERYITDQ